MPTNDDSRNRTELPRPSAASDQQVEGADSFFDDPSWRERLTASVNEFKARRRYSSLSVELLSSIADTDLELVVVDFIHSYIERSSGDVRTSLAALTPAFRAIYSTWWLEAEVKNGGFNQYFWNSAGTFAADAVAGLRLLGKPEVAALVLRAVEIWREDQDRMNALQLCGTVEAFCESYSGNRLNELDREFRAPGSDLSAARIRFIRAHLEQFVAALPVR